MAEQSDVFDTGFLRDLLVARIAGGVRAEMEATNGDFLAACLLRDSLAGAGVRLVMKNGKPEYVDLE
jgi:hypothetical protein